MRYRILFATIVLCSISVLPLDGQRVGVGTTTPSDALHVKGNASDHPLRVQIAGSTKFRVLNNGGATIGTNNVAGTSTNGLYVHGNTGMGVSFPADRLAVGGDMNITGMIKANGTAGAEGQVLTANASGGIEWTDQCRYENFDDFTNPAAGNNWTVPAGVTEIIVELWGAGGGGGPGGGGGGGGFVRVKLAVTPGSIYTFNIGDDGEGYYNGTAATNGGATTVTGPGIGSLSASGGSAASNSIPGLGGTASISSILSSTRLRGSHGITNTIAFAEYAAGLFAQIVHFGAGGNAANSATTGGAGALAAQNTVTLADIYTKTSRPGATPGGGGGGGEGLSFTASDGADGYAIVRW